MARGLWPFEMPFKIEGEFDVLSILAELLGILETMHILFFI